MKISSKKLKMIIAEEVARAELAKRRNRRRLQESRENVVQATPELINQIIREELERARTIRQLQEAKRRRSR